MDLPEGFHYTECGNGICCIQCDDQINITASKIGLPEEAEPFFKSTHLEPTFSDVLKISYNAQLPLSILPDEDGNICVNGEKIPLKDFVISPMGKISFTENHICVMPPPFQEPHNMDISGNGCTLSVSIQQIPHLSLTEKLFETIGETALKLSFLLDEASGSISISAKLEPTSSAEEALASRKILNAFASGEVTINGERLQLNGERREQPFSGETIDFWNRVVELERRIRCTFDAKSEIDFEQYNRVTELYRCFIEEKPFKRFLKDASIKGKGSFDNKSIYSSANPELMFAFKEDLDVAVMGSNLHLYACNLLFNCQVSFDELPEDNAIGDFKIRISPVEGKKLFSSIRYYLSAEDLDQVELDQEEISKYYNAEEIEHL